MDRKIGAHFPVASGVDYVCELPCTKRRIVLSRLLVTVVLIMADLFALEASAILAYWLRTTLFSGFFYHQVNRSLLIPVAFALTIFPVGYALMGCYPGYGLTVVERLRAKVTGTLGMTLLIVFIDWVFAQGRWSRGIILGTGLIASVATVVLEAFVRKLLMGMDLWGMPAVVAGDLNNAEEVIKRLQAQKSIGFRPIAVFSNDGKWLGKSVRGVPVVGGVKDLMRMPRNDVIAIFTEPHIEEVERLYGRRLPFRRVIYVPSLRSIQTLWLHPRDLNGLLGFEASKNLLLPSHRIVKRCSDVILGGFFFLLSAPLIGLLALLVKLADPGPAFFVQQREGRRGRMIRVWKLRTMYRDAEERLQEYLQANPAARLEWERYCKLKNDPRVLPKIGVFLRKTSLDELPQLWNVLKGEMSLVGPRPFPRYHLEKFPPDFVELRRSVRPGLTGLWQVLARSDGDLEVQEELDTYYIRNWSLWLDFYILLKTFQVLLTGKGAY